jgi:hypothetical protein
MQLVAFDDDQLSVDFPPLTTLEGAADKLTVGALLAPEVVDDVAVVVEVVASTSQAFTTPYAGSVPKNELVHCPEPLMLFCTHRVSAP